MVFRRIFPITLICISVILITIPVTSCNKQNQQTKMFEGDIAVSNSELKKIKNDVRTTGGTRIPGIWTDGIVPFVISSEFNENDEIQREEILKAMEEISGDTCIHYEPRNQETDYLFIRLGNRCSSRVGKVGGKQEVQMNPSTCMRHGTVVHELCHSLGLWHEQSRIDRDKYIAIKWDNIKPKSVLNFEKYENPLSRAYELPYDYSSIMHYSTFAFQKSYGLKTIIPKVRDSPMGLRNSMSYFDKLKINLMYKCKDDKK